MRAPAGSPIIPSDTRTPHAAPTHPQSATFIAINIKPSINFKSDGVGIYGAGLKDKGKRAVAQEVSNRTITYVNLLRHYYFSGGILIRLCDF
jgi:hypothetical protein